MTDVRADASGVPEIDLTDAEVLRDPAAAYGRVRERSPLARSKPCSANRDPRVFAAPERLDISREAGAPGHLGYAHGPHFCLGAAPARVQTEVALAALLRRFPGLALAGAPGRVPDPGTWRLAALPVTL
ncbi:cytochrome P450 [Streptosporangium canum]|uniref:cytochrome P450 n=1 Tax=Streptosporangium canum TaxID=324952 RepID=UPI00341E3E66